jgi:uncharacterized protein with PIN domain
MMMPDREKVIKEFEHLLNEAKGNYQDFVDVTVDFGEEILSMLKEQEAVEPEVEVLNEIDRLYRCPKCHKCFFYEKQKYCDQCGQAVKWNE